MLIKAGMSRRRISPEGSCEIEIGRCGQPIGKQDQYAAAFGGLNLIEFHQDEQVSVSPVVMRRDRKELLERRIFVFFTGITRSASKILDQQSAETATQCQANRT